MNDQIVQNQRKEFKTYNCNDCKHQAVLMPLMSNNKLLKELKSSRCLNVCTMNLSSGVVELGAFDIFGCELFERQEKELGLKKEKVRNQLDLKFNS